MVLNQDTILAGQLAPEGISGQLATAVGGHVGAAVCDLGARGIGIGSDMQCAISIMQSLTSDGPATVQFRLEQADDPGLSVGAQLIVASEVMPFERLKKDAQTILPIRYAALSPKRYLGLRIVIDGAPLTNTGGWCFAAIAQRENPQMLAPSGFQVF